MKQYGSRVVNLRHVKEPQVEIRPSELNLSDFSRSTSEATLMKMLKSFVKPNNNNFIHKYKAEKILSSHLLSKKLKVTTNKTIILPVVLYGCETWSLTLREEHRLRLFENKVLRKIFGGKKD